MANRFFVNGGVDNNWGTSGNWSTSSGGAGGAAVPTASDDVFLDGNSPDCTINASARVALSITFTGYANTITFSQQLTVTNHVTLDSGMTFAGASPLIVTSTCTFTSNGKTVGVPLTFSGATSTTTLADDLTTGALLTISPNSSATKTFNGNTLNVGSSLTIGGGVGNNFVAGTTLFNISGTGTWSTTQVTHLQNSLTINTAGTFTLSGSVYYSGGTLTYTAGTVVTTGSTLVLGSASGTLNCAGVTWEAVRFDGNGVTWTLSADLIISGTLTLNPNNLGTITINGNQIQLSGDLTVAGLSTGAKVVTGTTEIVLTGTGAWSNSVASTALRNPLTIDTAGTITVSGTVSYNTGTLTYVAGTVASSSGIINIIAGTATVFDLAGLVLAPVIQITTAGVGLNLASAVTIGGGLTLIGTAASPVLFRSNSGGTQRAVTVNPGALIDIGYANVTDIDSSGGDEVFVFKGTLSNTVNWTHLTPYTSPLTVGSGGGSPGGAVTRAWATFG